MFRQCSRLLLISSAAFACASQPAGPDPARPPSAPEPEAGSDAPSPTMMANAIYAPNPEQKALQDTAAARFHKSDGTAVIGFCVDIHGNTTDLAVVQPFPGDPMVDELLLETIGRWRFTPFLVDGRPIKTCSEKTFKLTFKGSKSPPTDLPTEPLEPLPPSLARDICVHVFDLLSASAAPPENQAEVDVLLHRCVNDFEAARQAQGDAAFERIASCILASKTIEEVPSCNPR